MIDIHKLRIYINTRAQYPFIDNAASGGAVLEDGNMNDEALKPVHSKQRRFRRKILNSIVVNRHR